MFKMTGVDRMTKKLEDLARNARELHGKHEIQFQELLSPEFLARHTRFRDAGELFEASGFRVESEEDFKAIPDEEWDEFINANTSFSNWEAMLSEAAKAWTSKKLGI